LTRTSTIGIHSQVAHDLISFSGYNFVDRAFTELSTHTILDDLLDTLACMPLVTEHGRVITADIGDTPHNKRVNNDVFLFHCQETFRVDIQREYAAVIFAYVIDERDFEMQPRLNIRIHDLTQTEQQCLFPLPYLKHGERPDHQNHQRQCQYKSLTVSH
jgi:hypothetical protein